MTAPIVCTHDQLTATITTLRRAGDRGVEGIVLWLAARGRDRGRVLEVYEPDHTAGRDRFHIPSTGMARLMDQLRRSDAFVAAQVHSHPEEAFHSEADDVWAIVRHVGAISIVLPRFAMTTTPDLFLSDAAIYRLAQDNQWARVRDSEISRHLRIVP